MNQQRQEFLRDVAITAVEGGIGYWASCRKYRWSADDAGDLDNMLEFPEIVIVPAEDPTDFEGPIKVTREMVQRGLRRIAEPASKDLLNAENRRLIIQASIDNDASNIDADCADAIVQFSLFGKLVFG